MMNPADVRLAPRYGWFLNQLVLGGQDAEAFENKSSSLRDPSKDGVGIPRAPAEKSGNTPVMVVIDSRALRPEDRESVTARLEALPEGSAVLFYADPRGPLSSRLIDEGKLKHLRFVRQSYSGPMNFPDIEAEVISRQREFGIKNVGFLFSDGDIRGLQRLGLVFQFPEALRLKYQSLRGLGGAALGEVTVRLIQNSGNERAFNSPYFESTNGVYFFLDAWVEARTGEKLLSVNA